MTRHSIFTFVLSVALLIGCGPGDFGSGKDGGKGGSAGRGTGGGSAVGGGAATGGGSGGGAATGGGSGGGAATGGGGGGGSATGGGTAGGPTASQFKVVVLGSSTAEGEGATVGQGWVSLLNAKLKTVVRPASNYSTTNLAVGGYTTSELLPNSGSGGSITDAIAANPQLILIALAGGNDQSNGTSKTTYMSRHTTMRDAAKNAGIPVFILTTAPKDGMSSLRDWAATMMTTFNSCWVPGSTTDHSPCAVDVYTDLASSSGGIASQYNSDGVHLNDAGHQKMYELILPVVQLYVCSTTQCN